MINVMTFNIYNWNKTDEHLRRICNALIKNQPDTVGFQEATPEWVEKILANPSLEGVYGYVGEHRGDFTFEMTPIFYRKDKFKVLEAGTRWYSDTPDEPSNFGAEGELYNRIYTYALLERISDGKQFVHVNTHLDLWIYFGENKEQIPLVFEDGELVQNTEADRLSAFCEELSMYADTVVLTGDFNAKTDSYVYKRIERSGFIRAQGIAKECIGSSEGLPVCQVLDHIYIKTSKPHCERYFIDDTRYDEELKAPVGHYPSDHLPRMATIKI